VTWKIFSHLEELRDSPGSKSLMVAIAPDYIKESFQSSLRNWAKKQACFNSTLVRLKSQTAAPVNTTSLYICKLDFAHMLSGLLNHKIVSKKRIPDVMESHRLRMCGI
jgi:hypothetical protein